MTTNHSPATGQRWRALHMAIRTVAGSRITGSGVSLTDTGRLPPDALDDGGAQPNAVYEVGG